MLSLTILFAAISLICTTFVRAQGQTKEVNTAQFHGRLYLPDSNSKQVAVLLIGGSEGHLYLADEIGPQLSKLGYVVLGIDYTNGYDAGRKLHLIPIETFTAAAAWLRGSATHPAFVAVLGDSRGSEAAFLTAVYDPQISAVIAIVPSSLLWGATDNSEAHQVAAWTWHGAALPCANCSATAGDFATVLDHVPPNAEARIPVEKVSGAVFLAGSEADKVWPSARMTLEIATRLRVANFAYPVMLLNFPDSSHELLGTGPKNPLKIYKIGEHTYDINLGGTAAGTENARNRTWAAMTSFLSSIPAH